MDCGLENRGRPGRARGCNHPHGGRGGGRGCVHGGRGRESASTVDEVVAKEVSVADEVLAEAASMADEVVAEAAPTAEEVAETASTGDSPNFSIRRNYLTYFIAPTHAHITCRHGESNGTILATSRPAEPHLGWCPSSTACSPLLSLEPWTATTIIFPLLFAGGRFPKIAILPPTLSLCHELATVTSKHKDV